MKSNKSKSTFINNIQRYIRVYGESWDTFIHICYLILIANFLFLTGKFILALYTMDYSEMITHNLYRFINFTMPPLLWIFSTKYEFYNFHLIKLSGLSIVLLTEFIQMQALIYQTLSRLFLPGLMEMTTDIYFTKNMVLLAGRVITQAPLILTGIMLYNVMSKLIFEDKIKRYVLSFKLSHYFNDYKKTEIDYSMQIVKNIKDGKKIIISLSDRFLHTMVDGTSGTGKTSSTILPAIKDDLNMRCKAEDLQKSLLKELENEGKVTLVKNSAAFSINNFIPISKTGNLSPEEVEKDLQASKDRLEEIKLSYPTAGITVIAPDDSLTDAVCKLAEARNIHYNRVDATKDENGLPKSKFTGINPFYIPPNIDPEEKDHYIVKKAIIYCDVMQAITDLKGKADSYFVGLNRQMIANIAILVMMVIPHTKSRQATPSDLQELINNFDLLAEPVKVLKELDKTKKQYTFLIQYIQVDLLGSGRVKMEDQSRGTRNIVNEFLLNPQNRKVFCSQNSIDFDNALNNGEITVCNYNLAGGDSDSLAFGLFFLLTYNNAVLSRPGTEKTRIPHFCYIDELPVLIHPSMEKNFSLFRKYGVAMFVAIQTLEQFQKNEVTKYLQGVILGCATMIVFGRSSLTDMEVFSAYAGVEDTVDTQLTTSETALSGNDPKLSYSSREIITQKNTVEQIDVRMKDFQEVTLFTTQNSRPLPPIHGKVFFLKKTDWKKHNRINIPFQKIEHEVLDNIQESFEKYNTMPSPPLSINIPATPLSHYITDERVYSINKASMVSNDEKSDTMQQKFDFPEGSESIEDIF